MKKRRSLEEEERALGDVDADPEAARPRLKEALASRRSLVVARAGRLIQKHRLEGFAEDLRRAFERFLVDGVKHDPSCSAKLAALEALDYGESADEAPFLRAVKVVQLEPAWGPPVDTAAGVRARGVVALARLGHEDLELVAAELLHDPEPPVRQAALDALAHRGRRSGAALALFKLQLGDEDPLVTLAAMNALLALAPDAALPRLAALLDAGDRELAAVALGQSRLEAALDLLLSALAGCVRSEERRPLFRGLGLFRSDRALARLLEVIQESPLGDAKAALEALSVRRFDPGVADRVRQIAADRPELRGQLAESFP